MNHTVESYSKTPPLSDHSIGQTKQHLYATTRQNRSHTNGVTAYITLPKLPKGPSGLTCCLFIVLLKIIISNSVVSRLGLNGYQIGYCFVDQSHERVMVNALIYITNQIDIEYCVSLQKQYCDLESLCQ